ncbi:MAG: hypothetical protein LDL12_04370, partial [Anaerolinea sp.]|nr:hypothetical protein [Anaerolinea sp.]
MKLSRILMAFVALVLVAGVSFGATSAQATTKALATNYTLVNLSPTSTDATVYYYLQDGSQWKAPDNLTIAGNGGQAIVRQYNDAALPAGRGSAMVTSMQPLAGLVQQIVDPAVSQVPTSGAYVAINTGSSKFYLPQVARNASSATGNANSWIIIQNLGDTPVNVAVEFTKYGASTPFYTKNLTGIASGASYYYDLSLETNLDAGFYSASIDAGTGTIGVVSDLFFGADGLMAFNAFAQEAVASSWKIPLVYSRLTNTLTTSVIVQNLDGASLPVGDVSMVCTPDPSSPDQSTLNISNTAAIPDKGILAWNTLTQTSIFPANWYGPCTVSSASGGNIVALLLYRYTGTGDQAGYEAIPGTATDTKVFVPLAAKTLSNKFCTAITVMNLSNSAITVNMTWTGAGSFSTYTETAVAIPANGSVIRNLCMSSQPTGVPMPAGWTGTFSATGTGPISAYVANRYNPSSG